MTNIRGPQHHGHYMQSVDEDLEFYQKLTMKSSRCTTVTFHLNSFSSFFDTFIN